MGLVTLGKDGRLSRVLLDDSRRDRNQSKRTKDNHKNINLTYKKFKNINYEKERAREKIIKRVEVEEVSDNEDEFSYAKSLRPTHGLWMEPIENKFNNRLNL